jgi:hypothetical protein
MFPNLILKNQYGETSDNAVEGGSSQLWCKFKMDSANANGLGISGLTGSGIASVYGHTSQTAATGNPNPQSGILLFNFSALFSSIISAEFAVRAPLSGSNINVTSGLTQYNAYVITAVGTTTASQWQTLGLPVGITPAVGAMFVAATASAGSGTGVVQVIAAAGSGTTHLEILGDPNETCNPSTGQGYVAVASLGGGLTMNSYTPAGTNNSATPPIFTGTPAVLTGSVANALAAIADTSWVFARFQYLPVAARLI